MKDDIINALNPENLKIFSVVDFGQEITLEDPSGQSIVCSANLFPKSTKTGDKFAVTIEPEAQAIRRYALTAKDILREMLKDD